MVDEKGSRISPSSPPTTASPRSPPRVTRQQYVAYDPKGWKTQDAEAKKRQIERGTRDQADSKDREKRAAACERSRSRLASLQNSQRIFSDNPDGTRSFLDDAQRESEVARAHEAADEYCR